MLRHHNKRPEHGPPKQRYITNPVTSTRAATNRDELRYRDRTEAAAGKAGGRDDSLTWDGVSARRPVGSARRRNTIGRSKWWVSRSSTRTCLTRHTPKGVR